MTFAIGAVCLLVGFVLGVLFHAQVESTVHSKFDSLHAKIDVLLAKAKVKL